MNPFRILNSCVQAFTEGERWPSTGNGRQRLILGGIHVRRGNARVHKEGAVGQPFGKPANATAVQGFNPKAVSVIISATIRARNIFIRRRRLDSPLKTLHQRVELRCNNSSKQRLSQQPSMNFLKRLFGRKRNANGARRSFCRKTRPGLAH